MTNSFLQAFASAAFPCYWLAPDGEFWANGAAEEVDHPLYNSALIHRLLTSLTDTPAEKREGLNLLGGAIRLWGLSVLPLEGGLLAVMTGSFETPVSTIGAQLREPLSNIFFSLPPLATHSEQNFEAQLEGIQRNCYTLLRLVTNLENAAIGSWKPKNLATIDLAAFLRTLVAGVAQVTQNRQVPIEPDLPDEPLPVRAHPRLLSEGILNVLRNSLQYTRDGNHIRVRLRKNESRAFLTIEDKGLGIKPKNLSRVFEPYFSADPYDDGAPRSGLGLGLTVTQEIARAHGGTVACESQFGEGTRVSLSLPLNREPAELLESEAAGYQSNRYSPVYVQLEGYCLPPALELPGL